MVLNMDCMRDILIAVEQHQRYVPESGGSVRNERLPLCDLYGLLPAYPEETVCYAVFQAEQAGFLHLSGSPAWGGIVLGVEIEYLTFAGHEFLASIREDSRWKSLKRALPVIRNYSLDALNALSQGMTSAAITAYLSKNPS